MAKSNTILFIFILTSFSTLGLSAYNVVDFGARPDGQTDSADAFLKAWGMACRSREPSIVYIPQGNFYVSSALFWGPCKNSILVLIKGTIIATSSIGSSAIKWLEFQNVQGLTILGGTLDGRGQALWACKLAHRSCPLGSISLTISKSKNVLISGLKSLNSKLMHVSIQFSEDVTVRNSFMIAPIYSLNTDGVHIQQSTGVNVLMSVIKTGDDCISMKPGTSNVYINHIYCGPGHGISIGSLADSVNEPGVQNITVKSVVFDHTQNGFRIKTWGRPSNGFVKDVSFHNAIMRNVHNPIIVDQNYCPNAYNCPGHVNEILTLRFINLFD
ncbi:uncharacterized protein A4U43_C09F5230 [Asparagus officinalis]|uniref:Pectate lyase superfamily protein domain-containing protein n=1 Tax=Asparagus officinalis TaxID=4686 RepID=A0A5P1E8T5_ASPOF|nr:uncharacterized protein A4U43_C09F5230 [Asparagus officinalis]